MLSYGIGTRRVGAAFAVKVVDGLKTTERQGLHSLGVWCVRGVYGSSDL